MRTRGIVAASSVLLVLPLLAACGPGGGASPGGGEPGDPADPPAGAAPELELAETDVLGMTAVATASNGAVLDIQLVVHSPEPFSGDGAADAWARTTEWCEGEIDDQIIADQGYSFTTVEVTATTREGQWPADTPLLLNPLPVPGSTIATTGDAVVQTNEPTTMEGVAGEVPHCAQPALLIEAGTGAIHIGIPGDIDGDADGTVPFGGWANRKYGVTVHLPGDAAPVDVTLSDCTVQITALGEELGAPTASWQEAFQDDLCVVGGDTPGVDFG